MYDKLYRDSCIRCYNKLDEHSIKRDNKKNLISDIFNIHINSLYNWIKEQNNNDNNNNENNNENNKYTNSKITIIIEQYVIKLFEENIKKKKDIKKIIKNKFNIILSHKDISYIFYINNLFSDKEILNKSIEKYIIDNIKLKCNLTAPELVIIIFNKFNMKISNSKVYNILKKNNFSYKRTTINSNPYSNNIQKTQLKAVIDNINKINKNEINENEINENEINENEIYKIDKNKINNIISIDEISITHFEQSKYGWTSSY